MVLKSTANMRKMAAVTFIVASNRQIQCLTLIVIPSTYCACATGTIVWVELHRLLYSIQKVRDLGQSILLLLWEHFMSIEFT